MGVLKEQFTSRIDFGEWIFHIQNKNEFYITEIIFFMFLFGEASYFDRINMIKNGLEYDLKNSHRQTWTLELDQKITPLNLNCRTWPKYGWIWPKINKKKH